MKTIFSHGVFFLFLLCLGPMVRADDSGAVKARMEQRLARIDALKTQGLVGENNRGFLEVRGIGKDVDAVVADENRDREAVYAAVAQKTGSSAVQVGKARAAKIIHSSRPGVWVQDESGTWKKR